MSGTPKKRVVGLPLAMSIDGGGIGMQLVAAAGRDLRIAGGGGHVACLLSPL
jgi:hypothetical protein